MADFYLENSDKILLKNMANFYSENLDLIFFIKNRTDFYLEKCRSDFY